jgi:O-antigen/teichoic acid export membrane protein
MTSTSNSRLLSNSIINNLGTIIQVIIALVLTPFLIKSLGDTQYGIWTIVAGLSGYMSLLDFGIASAVTRFVSKHHEKKEIKEINVTISSALAMFLVISSILVGISPIISQAVVHFIEIDTALIPVISALIIIVSFDMAIFILSGVLRGALSGFQRYDITTYIYIVSALYKAIALVVVLKMGFGLVGMGIISLTANAISAFLFIITLKNIYPFISIAPRYISKSAIKRIYTYGKYTFIGMISNQIIYYSDTFIVAYFLGAAAVTYYTIPWSLAEYSKQLFLAVGRAFVPAFSSHDAGERHAEISKLYLDGTRYMLIFSNLFCIGFLCLGGEFISIWLGPEYKEKCQWLVYIFFSVQLIAAPQIISYSMLQGLSKHKTYSRAAMILAFSNLSFSLILVQYIGLIGVALGAAIPQLVFYAIFVPFHSNYVMKISNIEYVKKTFIKVLPPSLALAASALYLKSIFPPNSFLTLIALAMVCAAIYGLFCYLFSLNKNEKEKIKNLVIPN